MSKAVSIACLGFPKAEGGPEAWRDCMSESWLEPGLPTGHVACPTCVLVRIFIITVRDMLSSKQFCSLGS